MMDKKKILVGMLVICAMLLTACGIKSPTEEELLEQLPREVLQFKIGEEYYDSQATKLTIEKQQTEDKSDVAYCQVVCESDVMNRTLYLTVYSSYENKRWKVDHVEEYQYADFVINEVPITLEEGRAQIENEGYSGIIEAEDCSALENGWYADQYTIHEEYENMTVDGTAWIGATMIDYGLGNYDWQNDSWDDIQSNWKITGTWENTQGDTITIEDGGTYYKMTYEWDQVYDYGSYKEVKRDVATGKKDKEEVEKFNRYSTDGYLVEMYTYTETSSRITRIRLFRDTAKGGAYLDSGTMKRIA